MNDRHGPTLRDARVEPMTSVLAAGGISTFGSLIGFIIAILIAYACASIARSKGRSPVVWGILGFFFTLIALVIIVLLPRRN
jgi:hypothetical protein